MPYRRVVQWGLGALTIATLCRAGLMHAWAYDVSFGHLRPLNTFAHWDMAITLYVVPFLLLLLAHEYAHMWACKRAGVETSGPYLLPWPSLLIGTVGAFIVTKGKARTRLGAFWIGASGPLASLALSLVFLAIGLAVSHAGRRAPALASDPFLMRALADGLVLHPLALVGRYGLWLTALNLLPLPPLDGWKIGQALYGDQWTDRVSVRPLRVLGAVVVLLLCWPF